MRCNMHYMIMYLGYYAIRLIWAAWALTRSAARERDRIRARARVVGGRRAGMWQQTNDGIRS